jgi:hypothetical protein
MNMGMTLCRNENPFCRKEISFYRREFKRRAATGSQVFFLITVHFALMQNEPKNQACKRGAAHGSQVFFLLS